MERILVIGSNGAGKSTFSVALAQKTGFPLTHIDKLYWRDNWEITPKDEFESAVMRIAQGDKWIIEGNNLRSLGQRLEFADTVFWFSFPPAKCMWNVIKREVQFWGRPRPGMAEKCVNRLTWRFVKDVWRFNRKNRSRIEQALADAPQVRVIRIRNYKQLGQYL